jgi:hypothetical protein
LIVNMRQHAPTLVFIGAAVLGDPESSCNFLGRKTDNYIVSSKASADVTTPEDLRQRYAYPYFRLHLEEIRTWLEGGCSAKAVWRSYAQDATPIERPRERAQALPATPRSPARDHLVLGGLRSTPASWEHCRGGSRSTRVRNRRLRVECDRMAFQLEWF